MWFSQLKRSDVSYATLGVTLAMLGFQMSKADAATVIDNGEIEINLSVESSSDVPLTGVFNISRHDLIYSGDAAGIDARANRDSVVVGTQYVKPVDWGWFSTAKGRIEYLNNVISPQSNQRNRYTTMSFRTQTCGGLAKSPRSDEGSADKPNEAEKNTPPPLGLSYCAGLGVQSIRYDAATQTGYWADYVAAEGASQTVYTAQSSVRYNGLHGPLYLPMGFATELEVEGSLNGGAGRYVTAGARYTQFIGVDDWPVRLKVRVDGATLSGRGGASPPYKRFFGGGFDNVRGYAYRAVSPFDTYGQPMGANNKVVGSAELMAQVFEVGGVPFVFSGFYDAGRFSGVDTPSQFKSVTARSYGGSLSLPFKQGLVRLSLAKPLTSGLEKQIFQIEIRAAW